MVCDNCSYEQRIIELEKKAEINSKQHQRYFDDFKQIAVSDGITQERYATILKAVESIQTDLGEIKDKPGKRWETIVLGVIGAVVVFVMGFVLKGGIQ